MQFNGQLGQQMQPIYVALWLKTTQIWEILRIRQTYKAFSDIKQAYKRLQHQHVALNTTTDQHKSQIAAERPLVQATITPISAI